MSAKKRVYDLAKEYGMTGQELASKLRDLGFAQVKSHMTALSEFEVLEVQARLEAYGIVGESSGQSVSTIDGLKIKRKKKKKAAPEPEEPAPAPEEEALEEEAVPAAPDEPAEAPPEPEETLVEEPLPEPVLAEEPEEVEAPPAPAAEEPLVAESVPAAETPEPPALPVEEEPAPIEEVAVAGTVEPAPLEAEAEAPEVAETAATPEKPDIVRPSAQRKGGKVVGFIDPSQFAKPPARKSESRRLRSSDDVVPDVMPTMGRDRHSGLVRGDTTRGTLTAQELRDREAGRFLRRRRPQQGADRGGRRGGGPRMDPNSGSPFQGGALAIEAPVTLKKLANTLAVKENEVLRVAMRQVGFGININSTIDEETAVLLANEFDVELKVSEEVAAEEQLLKELDQKREAVGEENFVQRAPCVAFLGHVDHGKTTLIDTIRESTIADSEAGGITQHIGAYQVQTQHGHTLTIVDTPGHAAFTAMRARGAQAVDVVVLVVAADDGVKPQTEEALNHARAAGTPIVVALNKTDKPEANPERVRNELAGLGLTPEEWGGDTAMLEVSGLKGDGLEELLERVFLESEVLELKSHPKGPASGVVLEAEIEKGKGKVAHLIIQDGSLKRGDVILAGEGYGKVRSIHNDRGKEIKEASPSLPVEVTGLNELPTVGDHFYVVESLDRAQEVAGERSRHNRQLEQLERRPKFHDNILDAVAQSVKPTINLIVKGDMQGSVEVLKHQLGDLQHDEVEVKVLHSGVGAVLESDVDLAITSDARILAFHVSANSKARQKAERAGIEIKIYRVIYEILDDVRKLMEGELSAEIREEITGHVEIRRIFKSSKLGNIAGCYVLDGTVARSSKVRLLRDSQVVYTGGIGSLRRESEDTKQVRESFECGIVLKDYDDIREGDVIETFKLIEIKRTL